MKCTIFAPQTRKEMKRISLAITVIALFMVAGCKDTKQGNTQLEVETEVITLPDSTLWGHLGEDTGMSILQFITDEGDTLEVYRTDPFSGEDGHLAGSIRNYTDRFALTVTSYDNIDGYESGMSALRVAINASQLAATWKNDKGEMSLKQDGTIAASQLPYNGWKLWNGHILMASQQEQEVGTVARIDTMDILLLNDDSLILIDHLNQELRFGK